MKHIHRFFLSTTIENGQSAPLEEADAFHAGRVLRLRAGDTIELAGRDGRVFTAEIFLHQAEVWARVLDELPPLAPLPELVVAQALPKGRKLDLVVEKLSEIGVSRLSPVYSAASARREPRSGGQRLDRWRRIARAAAGQSRRSRPMEVDEPVEILKWLAGFDGTVIALATETAAAPLTQALETATPPLALVVGPEAGFSGEELGALQRGGAVFATLGGRVLRTETAALVAAAVALSRLGGLG